MPRPPKKADAAKAAVISAPLPTMVPPPTAGLIPAPPMPLGAPIPTRIVDNDSFLRVRDSVSLYFCYVSYHPLPPPIISDCAPKLGWSRRACAIKQSSCTGVRSSPFSLRSTIPSREGWGGHTRHTACFPRPKHRIAMTLLGPSGPTAMSAASDSVQIHLQRIASHAHERRASKRPGPL